MEQWEIEKIERLIENNKKKSEKNLKRLIGQQFNELSVIEEDGRINGKRQIKCECSCGNVKTYDAYKVTSGTTKSCGCKKASYLKKARTTHSGRDTVLYSKWSGMKRRCYNTNDSHYKNYGALGITMCNEWKNDFGKFREWAYHSGYNDSLTIERKNPNKGYNPENCTWISSEYQAWTKRNTVHILYKGRLQPLSVVAKAENMNHKTLSSRYYRFKKRNPHIADDLITFDMLIPR